ncbi:MAG: hypothetical protein ACK5Z5_04915 [Neisseriaceae bacterium]|jgi:hypothetical protein
MNTFTQHLHLIKQVYNNPNIIASIVNNDGNFLYLSVSETQIMQSLKTIKLSIIKDSSNFLNLNKGII